MIDRAISLAAAGFVISGKKRDPFQQRGFAGAVFTDDDRERPVEARVRNRRQERQAERIGLAVGDARRLEPDPPEIRRRRF